MYISPTDTGAKWHGCMVVSELCSALEAGSESAELLISWQAGKSAGGGRRDANIKRLMTDIRTARLPDLEEGAMARL